MSDMDPIEKIIRPIVEGQIRGFLKEHPEVVAAVSWYKPGTDKAKVFTGSLSKRIVRDLTCPMSRARLAEAFLARASEAPRASRVECRLQRSRPVWYRLLGWPFRFRGGMIEQGR